jgi:hypothetical protein
VFSSTRRARAMHNGNDTSSHVKKDLTGVKRRARR